MTKFKIAITSDTVCPWCYVGKKNLEAGIAAYRAANPTNNDSFEVTWHPYQLNPTAPSPGVDKERYYQERFRDPERVRMMQQRLSSVGEQRGIHFKYGGRVGNTRDSHRLIDLAKSRSLDMQTKVVEQLFESYFEKEKDISAPQVLEEAGVKAGLPVDDVRALLGSDERGPEVDRELLLTQHTLLTGVPNFVLQDRYEIQGAQEPESFCRIFDKIKETES